MTFIRNFSGRAHNAAHSSNHGPGSSIHGLCSGVGATIPTGGSVDKSLDEMQLKAHDMDNIYHRSMSYKTQRVNKRKKLSYSSFMHSTKKNRNIRKT